MVATRARQEAHVLLLEARRTLLGLFELHLVGANLLVQELAGGIHVRAVVAEIALDEDRYQRLDDVLGLPRVRSLEGDGEQVVSRAGDGGASAQALDQALHGFVAGCRDVEIRRARHFLQIRAAEEGALHHADLGIDVVLYGDARQQGAKHGRRVDVDATGRGIAVRQARDEGPAGHTEQPGQRQSDPAAAPEAVKPRQKLRIDVFHRLGRRRLLARSAEIPRICGILRFSGQSVEHYTIFSRTHHSCSTATAAARARQDHAAHHVASGNAADHVPPGSLLIGRP